MLAIQSQPASIPLAAVTGVRYNPAAPSDKDLAKTTIPFDPERHHAFREPERIIMMEELGFSKDSGVSPVAVSQPFRLFSREAVEQMRAEILDPKVMRQCTFTSDIACNQLRGYASRFAPFTYDAWTHPDTLAILSKIAGVELVPQMDYEIGHINFSAKSTEQVREEKEMIRQQDAKSSNDITPKDDKPIVGWHRDSYPFVCVLMLSDCTDMVGGETALLTADGEMLKVRGPEMGCAVILQGRYITHQALRALGAKERITSVTSLRPKSPLVRDDTVLTTVRPISDLSELYYSFAQYRLEMLEERIRATLKGLRSKHAAGKKTDVDSLKSFLKEQMAFLEHTDQEIVQEDLVIKGQVPQPVIDHVVVGGIDEGPSKKRLRMD